MRYLITAFFLASAIANAADSFTVISAGKGWIAGKGLITRGQALNSEALISAGKDAGELVVDCKRAWVQYVCTNACEAKICVERASDPSKFRGNLSIRELTVFGKASTFVTESYLRRQPRELATLGVRAGGNPSDAVLLQNAQGVHWGPALNRILEGRYCLLIAPLPSGPPRIFMVDWNRAVDKDGVGPAPNLIPGVYELKHGTPGANGACTVDPDTTGAWVTIVPESQFDRISAEWKEQNARVTQLERSDAGPEVAALLRHAVLASLADSSAAK